MECPRGSTCKESTHHVTTMKKAIEWFDRVIPSQLPIKVDTLTAENGRMMARIFDASGKLIHTRG